MLAPFSSPQLFRVHSFGCCGAAPVAPRLPAFSSNGERKQTARKCWVGYPRHKRTGLRPLFWQSEAAHQVRVPGIGAKWVQRGIADTKDQFIIFVREC